MKRSLEWLVLALMLAAPVAQAAAVEAERAEQWAQAVRSAGTADFARNSRAYLEQALSRLELLSGSAAGVHRPTLTTLRKELGDSFFDAARVHQSKALERTLLLVEEIRTAWLSGQVREPLVLEAASELVLALRQAAEVSLSDARLMAATPPGQQVAQRPRWLRPEAWERMRRSLREAEQAWQHARRHLTLGEEQQAGRHLLSTWRLALEALGAAGVHFHPGSASDVDGDKVPDPLELRYGASPLLSDTDGDGLSDHFEMYFGGAELLPANPDTDEDGVEDGREDSDRDGHTNLQEQTQGTDPLRAPRSGAPALVELTTRGPVQAMRVKLRQSEERCALASQSRSLPLCIPEDSGEESGSLLDPDGDGLEDQDEAFYGTPPMQADWDREGLNDSDELAHATEPGVADTDEDGFSDAYEVAHRADGFDPLVPDERMTPQEWARDYSDGLVLGDTCDTPLADWKPCKSTVAFFLGQVSGGTVSFVPVVGWIVGAVADVRDGLGSAVKGDWVGAGLGLVGVLPYVGDVGKLAGKVVAFAARYGKLETVLRAILLRLPRVVAASPRARWLPAGDTGRQGEMARRLVLEVLRKVDPQGFSAMRRYGGDAFLTRLAAWGTRWEDMALLFNRLEQSGLFSQYPRMQRFIEEMVRTTPDELLFKGEHILSLNGRVTLNLKKAALRLKHDPPKYLETVRNHLRAALAEHSTLSVLPGDAELIPLRHITANGVDRAYRHKKTINVMEVKAASHLGLHDLKNWIDKVVDPRTGEALFAFNGARLEKYLRKSGQPGLERLLMEHQFQFKLFIYDAGPRLTPELEELFKSGSRIPLMDSSNIKIGEITLALFKHWD